MPTNFEYIEINDAADDPQKVGGDFEAQGADSLFHQTARNLNTVLEEKTGVTLTSTSPGTIITLNGMESHVLVDIGATLFYPLQVSLQYTTGGLWYAADWERMQPIRTYGSIRDTESDKFYSTGYKGMAAESYAGAGSGSHVFMIPTHAAVACRLRLTGSSVTVTGTAWKRVVLASPPVQHTVGITSRFIHPAWCTPWPSKQPYTDGQLIGNPENIGMNANTGGESVSLPTVRQVKVNVNKVLPDFDFIFLKTVYQTDKDEWEWDYGADIYGVVEFRAAPVAGQHKLYTSSTSSFALADDLNMILPVPYEAGITPCKGMMVARGAYTGSGSITCNILLEF